MRRGASPSWTPSPNPKEEVLLLQYTENPHTDMYLHFHSSHSISAKTAVVRALMDRVENVCSDPDILAKKMDHLNRVLCYNYPQWIINQ